LESASSESPAIPPSILVPERVEPGQPESSNVPPVRESTSISRDLGEAFSGSNLAASFRRPEQTRFVSNPDFGPPPTNRNINPPLAEFDKTLFTVGRQKALDAMEEDVRKEFEKVDWKLLYDLREMDLLEKQAENRGGWGRLSWEEFEHIIKGENASPLSEGSRRAMMDFLGSWIEFCIP
jgi:hypothetical protein